MAERMRAAVQIEAAGQSDVGMKRRINEDVFVVDHDRGVFLVADGMGGHAAGEVASQLAAQEILRLVDGGSGEDTWPDMPGERSREADRLVRAILAGHATVTRAVAADEGLKGMGTTVVAALHPAGSSRLVVGHVGDSRAYRLRGGSFDLLTEDHSWVHEQVAAGFLSEEAARSHPLKNVVTQALGGANEPRVDTLEVEVEPDDLYLLCSDGLNSMLTDAEIADVLRGGGRLDEMIRRLIVGANERGGNDNITVVLLRARPIAA